MKFAAGIDDAIQAMQNTTIISPRRNAHFRRIEPTTALSGQKMTVKATMAAIGRCANTMREECTIYALYAGSRLTRQVAARPTEIALIVTLPGLASTSSEACSAADIVGWDSAIERF